MKLEFNIGKGIQTAEFPKENLLCVLHANPVTYQLTGTEEIDRALAAPIGAPPVEDVIHPGEKTVIVTSDITRPCPSWLILPPLLRRLWKAGVRKEDVTVVFALGSHRHHTHEEMAHLVGAEVLREVACVDSDSENCVCMGVTRRGTPVNITAVVAGADRKICLGNIEYHYFAGYSGGGKAIMPGVSNREAIQANHSMMVLPDACAGKIEGNPLREDMEEAAKICGVDYLVNVVLDEQKRVVKAVAGDFILAHREGCRFIDRMYSIKIEKRADIVLVSQGGAPKDLNLYQTQKALDNAKHAVRPGGIIILIGSCNEGLGEETFARWINEAACPDDLINRVRTDFQLGGHKAAAIAMVLKKSDIYLVSEMPDELAAKCFLKPFPTVQQALDAAFGKLGPTATVLAMPFGGSTLPIPPEDGLK